MKRSLGIYSFMALSLLSCQAGTVSEAITPSQKQLPIDGTRIAWDYNSLELLSDHSGYPRLRRLSNGMLITVFDSKGDVMMRTSTDDGKNWTQPIAIFTKHKQKNLLGDECMVNMANSEIYQLANGCLIAGCNYRPEIDGVVPFAIAIRRSQDNGQTWEDIQVLYEAGTQFGDGCWEPSFLQLPNGDLHVYFANEGPFMQSDEQEISVLISSDNGESWTKQTKQVCFRSNRRDGMPTAILLDNEIVVAIEDNNIAQFKPYTVRTNINNPWETPVLYNSPDRHYALNNHLPDFVYAGAPYLLKLPSGETLLSYQTTENRTTDWEKSTLEVAIGDKEAKSFDKISRPIDVSLDREAKWNSITLFNNYQVAALASTNFNANNIGAWMIKGYILNDIKLPKKKFTTEPILFVGHMGDTQAKGYLYQTDNALNVKIVVDDPIIYGNSISKTDGVVVSIDPNNNCYNNPSADMYRFSVMHNGQIAYECGNNAKWVKVQNISVNYQVNKLDKGYEVILEIPYDVIGKTDRKPMRLNMTLAAYKSDYIGYRESLPHAHELKSNTWIKLLF